MKRPLLAVVLVAACAGGAGWWWLNRTPDTTSWQGYADAEYVRVSPTLTGRIVSIAVARGDQVAAGAPLFMQDDADDKAARDAAAGKLAEFEARLNNLKTASRDTEIAQARADLADLMATRDRIAKDLMRNQELMRTGAASRQTVDQQRADLASAVARVEAANAKLEQMRSPTGRQYEIAAQSAMVEQARAALAQAQWQLDQRRVASPVGAMVADTYARPGETINAGVPVVSLLPPENILVRFFVPETELATIHVGDQMAIGCDGCAPGLTATVSFIAPQPEYTPPVIYSESNRDKLVYLIEAHPQPAQAVQFKPGQPVDVRRLATGATATGATG
jgi:HlyD family secretion protein